MIKVLVVTLNFPFEGGESFLEEEYRIWLDYKDVELIFFPVIYNHTKRVRKVEPSPETIFHNNKISRFKRTALIAKSVFSLKPYSEMLAAYRLKRSLNLALIVRIFKSTYLYFLYEYIIKNVLDTQDELISSVDVVYSYWNGIYSFPLVEYISNRTNCKIVSRLHGLDLYEERYENNYYPYKRAFIHEFSELHFLSEKARSYAVDKYNISQENTFVNPLGVDISPSPIDRPLSKSNEILVLSVSSIIPIKQVERIPGILLELKKMVEDSVRIKWVHIGDGPLKSVVLEQVAPFEQAGLTYEMLGNLPHYKVLEFFQCNAVDVFVNTSSDEGVPVSIMEAMACGVPIVAPNVGSIDSLVSTLVGSLVSGSFTDKDFALAIMDVYTRNQDDSLSYQAWKHIFDNYNSRQNFERFIDHVIKE